MSTSVTDAPTQTSQTNQTSKTTQTSRTSRISKIAEALHPDPVLSTPRLSERNVGLLVVRAILGVTLVAHGAQKLFGAWGGGGIHGTAQMFAAAGYSPAEPIAVLGGLIEFGGGILLVLGLAAPFAAAAITANMAGATAVTVSSAHGAFFSQSGGFEDPLLLLVVALGLTLTGPGRLSFDGAQVWNRPIVRRGLAVLAVLGGVIAIAIR